MENPKARQFFKVGAKLWYLDSNEIKNDTVTAIFVRKENVKYFFGKIDDDIRIYWGIEENKLFATKEKLLKSL